MFQNMLVKETFQQAVCDPNFNVSSSMVTQPNQMQYIEAPEEKKKKKKRARNEKQSDTVSETVLKTENTEEINEN